MRSTGSGPDLRRRPSGPALAGPVPMWRGGPHAGTVATTILRNFGTKGDRDRWSGRRVLVHRVVLERRETTLDKISKLSGVLARLALPLGVYLLAQWLLGLHLPAELLQLLANLEANLAKGDVLAAAEATAEANLELEPYFFYEALPLLTIRSGLARLGGTTGLTLATWASALAPVLARLWLGEGEELPERSDESVRSSAGALRSDVVGCNPRVNSQLGLLSAVVAAPAETPADVGGPAEAAEAKASAEDGAPALGERQRRALALGTVLLTTYDGAKWTLKTT